MSSTPLSLQHCCACIAHLTQSQNPRQIHSSEQTPWRSSFWAKCGLKLGFVQPLSNLKMGTFMQSLSFPAFQKAWAIRGWNTVVPAPISGTASLALSTASHCPLALNLVHFSHFYHLYYLPMNALFEWHPLGLAMQPTLPGGVSRCDPGAKHFSRA